MGQSVFWNAYAKVYDALPACFPPYRELLDRTLATIRECEGDGELKVLDAGCGTGNYTVALADAGYSVSAMDTSTEMLSWARRKIDARQLPVQLCRASLEEPFPFADNAFDVVININALYMLSRPEAALAEFARVVKPGGTVITVNPRVQPSIVTILKDSCRRYGLAWLLRGAPLLLALGIFNWLIGMRFKSGAFFFWDRDRTTQALTEAGLEVQSLELAYTADTNLFAVSIKPASPKSSKDGPECPGTDAAKRSLSAGAGDC